MGQAAPGAEPSAAHRWPGRQVFGCLRCGRMVGCIWCQSKDLTASTHGWSDTVNMVTWLLCNRCGRQFQHRPGPQKCVSIGDEPAAA